MIDDKATWLQLTPIDANAICKSRMTVGRLTPGTKLPQETCYPMMHTASAVPLTPHVTYVCTYIQYISYISYMQLPEPAPQENSFRAHFPLRPLPPFYPSSLVSPFYIRLSIPPPFVPNLFCFFKNYKSQTDLGQGRRMIKPHREPLCRHGNRILLFRPEEGASPVA